MAISVINGSVPYYGVFANKAVLLNGVNSSLNPNTSKNHRFCYIFPWDITFGGSTYYAVFEGNYYLNLYKKNPDTEYSLESYYDDDDNELIDKAYKAIQPFYSFDLLNPRPVLDGSSLNARGYVYEHSEFVFFHFDFFGDVGGLEVVVTKGGHIQYKSTGDSNAYGYTYSDKAVYFSSLSEGCSSCTYRSVCTYYSASNTSCGYGTTYTLETSKSKLSNMSNYREFLLIPPTSGSDFTLSTTQCLDLANYMTESNGEVSCLLNNELHRVPLLRSKNVSKSNLSVRVGGSTKYVAFSDDTASESFSAYTPLRVKIGGTVKSPYLPRVISNKKHILRNIDREQREDIRFYTNTGSSYRYYGNAIVYTLSERVRVKQIRVFGYQSTGYNQSISGSQLPNSSYPATLMMVNTGTSDLNSDWTPSNTDQSITFEVGYVGSGGKCGQNVCVTKDVNMYVKQFTFTPACSYASSAYSGSWLFFEPAIIELVEYNTGNTYYYQI